jgi:hypothetical protein
VADIIESENPVDRLARRDELLNAIKNNEDPELSALVEASAKMFKAMYRKRLNVIFGGGGEGGQNNGPGGGGVGGEAGDGADFSPIPNARCDFALKLDGAPLFYAAFEDLRDGKLDRPDLADIKDEMEEEIKDIKDELQAAFEEKFPGGVGEPYSDDAEDNGTYFLPIPPNVQGFVRCTPPSQPKLKLATLVPKLQENETRPDQDVKPQTTVFSSQIATELEGDLGAVKNNFLTETDELRVGYKRENGEITKIEVIDPKTFLENEETDAGVGLVAFSATSLFNIFFQDEINVDYLAALDNFIANGEVDADFLHEKLGLPRAEAENAKNVVNESVTEAEKPKVLNIQLEEALTTARIKVTVTDQPVDEGGQGIPDVTIDITSDLGNVKCNNCGKKTDGDGKITLTLTKVSTEEAIQIEVKATPPETAKFKATVRTTEVVAFATVDLNIPFTYKLTVGGSGTGKGTVTSDLSGIDCNINNGVVSDDCSENYDADTEVTLTADPRDDSTFDGWSGGGCSGTGDCKVTMDQSHTVIATFVLAPVQPTGSLQVTIEPPEAITAGAQWRVVGDTWRNSGFTQSGLSVGSHRVEFKDVSGWDTPDDKTVTIIANQTTTTKGIYERIQQGLIWDIGNWDEKNWQ